MVKVVRGIGWLLLVSGAVVLLYVVYLLWFTGLETNRAQDQFAQNWEFGLDGEDVDVDDQPDADDDGEGDGDSDDNPDVDRPTDAYAAIWFERDGERIINDEIQYVVDGVSLDYLKLGPGHYPQSDRPGGEGNLAIAGHRTTYGSPFWSLNELTDGDTIHVMDRDGNEWTYAYREQTVVMPNDLWVVGSDPLETGNPTITITTCHPRGSARERLVAWGELIDEPIESTADEGIDEGPIQELPEA